jgi:hypothetical protein
MLPDFPSPRQADEVAEGAETVSSKGTDKAGDGKGRQNGREASRGV